MSLLNRVLLIIKSYAHSTSSKIERLAAEEELRHASGQLNASKNPNVINLPPVKAMNKVTNQLSSDYSLLGVKPDSDIDTVQSAWRRLAQRADPKRFPSGSEEEKKASEILKSINEAYERIREAANPTEGRFGQLEL